MPYYTKVKKILCNLSYTRYMRSIQFKKFIPTIIFYGAVCIIIVVSYKYMGADACNPGLGDLLIIILPVVSFLLFLKNLIKAFKVDRDNKIATDKDKRNIALIHLAISLIMVAYIIIEIHRENSFLK